MLWVEGMWWCCWLPDVTLTDCERSQRKNNNGGKKELTSHCRWGGMFLICSFLVLWREEEEEEDISELQKPGKVIILGIEIGHWWQVYHVPDSVILRVRSERKERPLNEARTCLERQTGGDWKRAWLPLLQTLNQLHLHTHSSARTGSTCTQAPCMTPDTESYHIWPGRHHSQSTVVPYTSPLNRSIVPCQTWFVFVCWQH